MTRSKVERPAREARGRQLRPRLEPDRAEIRTAQVPVRGGLEGHADTAQRGLAVGLPSSCTPTGKPSAVKPAGSARPDALT